MGSKKNKRQKLAGMRDGGTGASGDPTQDPELKELFYETVAAGAVLVEGAGGLQRAIDAGLFEHAGPALEPVRNLAPVDRGGKNDDEGAHAFWQKLVSTAMHSAEYRQAYQRAQQAVMVQSSRASG
jgi:hypothetical protein